MSTTYVHGDCGTPITFRDDGNGHTTYVCERCKIELGYFQDLGTVDLDEVRAAVAVSDENHFEVFGQEPW